MTGKHILVHYPLYVRRPILQEWLSPADLLKITLSYPYLLQESLQYKHVLLDILMGLFLKNRTLHDADFYGKFSETASGKAAIRSILSEPDFQSLCEREYKRIANLSGISGYYRFRLFRMLTHNKVAMHRSEARVNDQNRYFSRQFYDGIAAHKTFREKISYEVLLDNLRYRIDPPEAHLSFIAISMHTCESILNDIALLPPIEIEQHFVAILRLLDNPSQSRPLRNAILNALIAWNPKFNVVVRFPRRLMAELLSEFKHPNADKRRWALETVALLLPTTGAFESREMKQLIEPSLAMLFDEDQWVRKKVLKIIAVLMLKFETQKIQALMGLWLAKLDTESDDLRVTLLEAIALLTSKFTSDEIQQYQLLQRLFNIFNNRANPYLIRFNILKTIAVTVNVLNADTDANIAQSLCNDLLEMRDDTSINAEALRLTATLLRTKTITDIDNVISKLMRCLHHNIDYIREIAFEVLSEVVVNYPNQTYTLSARGEASVEEVALIKIREMHALLQAPKDKKYITHSTLKTIVDTTVEIKQPWYARASMFFMCTTPQQSCRSLLNELLSENKLCYEQEDIETALDTHQDADDENIRVAVRQGF